MRELWGVAGLPMIERELRLGQTGGHEGVQPIGDGLKVKILLVVDPESKIQVDRLRTVVAVSDKSVFPNVADEEGGIEVFILLAYGEGLLMVPE